MTHIRAPKGFTLVEMIVTVAILGIMVTIAVPSFNTFIDQYRVKRAADTISSFLVNAKSEAIKRNTTARAVFQSDNNGETWCVGMTTASTCDCTSAGSCQIDSVDRLLKSSDFQGVVLNNPSDAAMFSFSPLRGTVNSGNAEVESGDGLQVRVVVAGTGRIRLCSPSGSGNIGGYAVCP